MCGPFQPHPDHKGHRALAPMLAPNISRMLHMAPFARGRLLRALSGAAKALEARSEAQKQVSRSVAEVN